MPVRAENCGDSLRYCTARIASIVMLYCSVTRSNHSFEPVSYTHLDVYKRQLLFMGVTAFIVYNGVEGGIERVSRYMMPILLVLVGGIAGCLLYTSRCV